MRLNQPAFWMMVVVLSGIAVAVPFQAARRSPVGRRKLYPWQALARALRDAHRHVILGTDLYRYAGLKSR